MVSKYITELKHDVNQKNVEEIMDLENYHFATIRVIADSSLWIIKLRGEKCDEEIEYFDGLKISAYLFVTETSCTF